MIMWAHELYMGEDSFTKEFFVVCYFADANNIPHPMAWFVLQIRWRLYIGDTET